VPGTAAATGATRLAGRRDGHRCRSNRHAQQRRHDPADEQRRDLQACRAGSEGLAGARAIEHAAKPAARADDQQHAGEREQRRLGRFGELFHRAAASCAEDGVGRQRDDQHRDRRRATEVDPAAQWMTADERGVSDRCAEHEEDWQEDEAKCDRMRKGRQVRRVRQVRRGLP
jgi:hypothetical protein